MKRAWATLLVSMTLLASNAYAEVTTGKVIGVSDGDTLTILVDRREVKIRISGIDAPEKNQPFGQASKQHMSNCAFGKQVVVEWHKVDRYGRTIGKVLSDEIDCGLSQVEAGLAWHYKAYVKEQTPDDKRKYGNAETRARAESKGLWKDEKPTPPWDFRHRKANNVGTTDILR
jgi:endonuclease YncB( thermonuclease family)